MPLTKVKIKEGELSTSEQINEKIRKIFNYDKTDFYSMSGHGSLLKEGFMYGLWVGCHGNKNFSNRI